MTESKARLRVNRPYTHLRNYSKRFEVLYGGAGSGKSYGVAQNIIHGALNPENKGRKYVCVRKVARTLRHSIFALLREIISDAELDHRFSINRTEMAFASWTGAEIILIGLDDVEKMKSIHGVTDVWMEEATEFSPADVKQMNLRLRGLGHQKRIIMTFNPILNTHWLKTEFFDRPRENVRVTKTTYKDNAFLDSEYKAELESLQHTDPYWYQVYTLGEWGQLGNVVFTNFVIEDFDYKPGDLESFGGGIDFGFNHPSAVVLAGMRDGEIYIYDEVYQKGLTNAELIEVASSIDPEQQYAYIADSAEPDRIREWIQKGWDVRPAKKGKDSIRYGVDWMRGRKIHIHATRCPNTANEIQAYHYKEDRGGALLDDPVDLNNHCFVGETRVSTPEGKKRIDELKIGDFVLTRNGPRRIKAVFRNKLPVITVRLLNGQLLTLTDTHHIITARGEVEYRKLCKHDIVYYEDVSCGYIETVNQKLPYLMAKNIAAIQRARNEARDCISGSRVREVRTSTCTSRYTASILGRLLKGAMFITKMAILSIMTRAISFAWTVQNIQACIASAIMRITRKPSQRTLTGLDRLRRHGIQAMRGSSGIRSMQRRFSAKGVLSKRHANSAAQPITSMSSQQDHIRDFVPTPASLPGVEDQGSMTSNECASFAGNRIWPTSIRKSEPVPESAVLVYDIEVDGEHEYFANGLLVSNSIDATRYHFEDLWTGNIVEGVKWVIA